MGATASKRVSAFSSCIISRGNFVVFLDCGCVYTILVEAAAKMGSKSLADRIYKEIANNQIQIDDTLCKKLANLYLVLGDKKKANAVYYIFIYCGYNNICSGLH